LSSAVACVFRVRKIDENKFYSAKVCSVTDMTSRKSILREIGILSSVIHPCVISFKEAFFDDKALKIYIIQDYADEGTLFQRIQKSQKEMMYIREPDVWRIFLGIAAGMTALHNIGVFWMDCKSENVYLFSTGAVKIGGFKYSKISEKEYLLDQIGSPNYAAPEVWQDLPYSKKADIWSLGCVVFETVSLRPPFKAESLELMYLKIVRGSFAKIPHCYSSDVSYLIQLMLIIDPLKRPNISQILDHEKIIKHRHLATNFGGPIESSRNIGCYDELPASQYEKNRMYVKRNSGIIQNIRRRKFKS
jgi:NIMA (never in mitosis gene a)-related kinase 1/4/5